MNQQGRAAISGWAQRWRRGEVTPMMFLSDECREDLENVIDRIVTDATAGLVEERRIMFGAPSGTRPAGILNPY